MTPAAGSRWRALYRRRGETSGWHDEDRVYEVDRVSDGTLQYHCAWGPHDKAPSFTIPEATWAEWASDEGASIGMGERMRMVPF